MYLNSKKNMCMSKQKNYRLVEVGKAKGLYIYAVKEGCPTVLSDGSA
jgi:hypothetical protein